MYFKLKELIFLCLFLFSVNFTFAQNIKSTEIDSLQNADINKAQKAMQDAGLSVEDAATIARQKGATEQQILDFRNRLLEGNIQIDSTNYLDKEATNQTKQQNFNTIRTTKLDSGKQIFGSYLFNSVNLTFEPSLNIQIPKHYEIGIGDQMIINIWGNSQINFQINVNQNGQIIIPDVGPVFIAGLTFQNAERKIKQRLTSIYADMVGNNPQTFAQVNLGQLRSVKVNLVGEVTAPGTYTLPVTSTVFNALYLSGGSSKIGSFRNIKIIRNNEVFKTVDIYKFLIDADPSDNILLKDEDIVFIPPVEKQVEALGEFKRSGIFELKEEENLDDLIRFAGGFTKDSYSSKLQILRKTHQGLKIIDVNIEEAKITPIVNGDEIRNGKILDEFENRITILGAVYRPGEYEWTDDMTLIKLIEKADNLEKDAFMNRGIINRENPDLTTTIIPFNVKDIISGKTNILLQPEDVVMIKSQYELQEQRFISVFGEVLNPAQFAWSENMTLSDAIFLAGGFTESADSSFIEVARRLNYEEAAELTDKLVHVYTFKLNRNLELTPDEAGFVLKPFDKVAVRQAPGFRNQISAVVLGEVKHAGIYAIRNKNQRISDLIKMAGGVTPNAFLDGATLSRTTNLDGIENVAINLSELLNQAESEFDLFLRDGDKLSIPEYVQTVKISGNVQNPFSLTYEKGKKLKYYIDKSGGFKTDALKRKIFVQYANGTTSSTKNFIFKSYPEVLPGSQIIVPSKPEKNTGDTGRWLAIASTFSSIAVAIVALLK